MNSSDLRARKALLHRAWLRAIRAGDRELIQAIEDGMRRLDPPSREVIKMQQEYARARAEAGHGFTGLLVREVRAAA